MLLTPLTPGLARTCSATYSISDGTTAHQAIVSFQAAQLLLFADDFESGTVDAWSACEPGC